MNQHGAAGTTGLNASIVVEFLDAQRVTVIRAGTHRNTINGFVVSTNDARVIRRWRNVASAVTRRTAERVFWAHGLTLDDFERWVSKPR